MILLNFLPNFNKFFWTLPQAIDICAGYMDRGGDYKVKALIKYVTKDGAQDSEAPQKKKKNGKNALNN